MLNLNILNIRNFNSLGSAEIRIEKDLLELRKFKFSTKMFIIKYSNVIKNLEEENFKMFVSLSSIITSEQYMVIINFY